MPVPTDTLFNIPRLNRIFALSALLLLISFCWAIWADYNQPWRTIQQHGRIWEAMLLDTEISQAVSPDRQKQIDELTRQIESTSQQPDDESQARLRRLQSRKADLEFRLGALRTDVSTLEVQLQQATVDVDTVRADRLRKKLDAPSARPELEKLSAELADVQIQTGKLSAEVSRRTAKLDALRADLRRLTTRRDELARARQSVQPDGVVASISAAFRRLPLLQFLNPSEKIRQVVTPDVQTGLGSFKQVETIDRCTTCHINIADQRYARDAVITQLERQVALARGFRYPLHNPQRDAASPLPTLDEPGATAFPEFWQAWGHRLLRPDSYEKSQAQSKLLLDSVGHLKVMVDGHETIAAEINSIKGVSDAALSATIVSILANPSNDKDLARPRTAALQYPGRLRALLAAELSVQDYADLIERYRRMLVAAVNTDRAKAGQAPLDPSPVFLAHPRAEMFVDPASPHPIEVTMATPGIGCTACHDGAGAETDFLLTGHTPARQWVDRATGEPVPKALLPTAPIGSFRPDLSSMLSQVWPDELRQSRTPDAAVLDYVDPVTGQTCQATIQQQQWNERYASISGKSIEAVRRDTDRPMLAKPFVEASCARCHTETYDIREAAPTLYAGRMNFTKLGCVNCHQSDSIPAVQNRRVGPDLRHVGSKLSPAFVDNWIWSPQSFRPTTRMPHAFNLENNSTPEELRRTRQEARAMTEYLLVTSDPLPALNQLAAGTRGQVDSGRSLFRSIGCIACHVNLNERADETTTETIALRWITQDLIKTGVVTNRLQQQNRRDVSPADLQAEARRMFMKMGYAAQRHYIQQHFQAAAETSLPRTYPDGSPMPVFVNQGPELSDIGSKLLADRKPDDARQWLVDWLIDPRHYSGYTIMPRLRLSPSQAIDLAEYLLNQRRSDDWSAQLSQPDAAKLRELVALQLRDRYTLSAAMDVADDENQLAALAAGAIVHPGTDLPAAMQKARQLSSIQKQMVFLGSRMVTHYGCMNCHAINQPAPTPSPCPNLSEFGDKRIEMLDFGYLDPEKRQTEISPRPIAITIATSIHAFPTTLPTTNEMVVDWPRLDFTRSDWLLHKLDNPRIFDRGRSTLEPQPGSNDPDLRAGRPYDKLRMPCFFLNADEIRSLATFVLSNRQRLVSDRITNQAVTTKALALARGRQLAEAFNCLGCHQTDATITTSLARPAVQQWFKPDELLDRAPPPLRDEGSKVRFNWLSDYFKAVRPIRPLLEPVGGLRMPSFPASDEQWTTVLTWLHAGSQNESDQLRHLIEPVARFIAAANVAYTARSGTSPIIRQLDGGFTWHLHPELQPTEPWPGDDWCDEASLKPVARALRLWAVSRRQMIDADFDPTRNTGADLRLAYRSALYRAVFTASLMQSPFPFAPPARSPLAVDSLRLSSAREFVHEMQCLTCHVVGDPAFKGALSEPKAPNFAGVPARLQMRWVRQWIQEPQILQPGTKMLSFFSGLGVYDPHGLPWAVLNKLSADVVNRTAGAYGATVDQQTDLILDYLSSVGPLGINDVQPTTQPTTLPYTH